MPNQAWGLANVSLEGVDSPKAYDFLWTKYRIITASIKHAEYQGLRVTPNIYTTLEEIDTFAGAIEALAEEPGGTGQRQRLPARSGPTREMQRHAGINHRAGPEAGEINHGAAEARGDRSAAANATMRRARRYAVCGLRKAPGFTRPRA